ncbi:MAG: WbqC family protein [Bacteroidales bacterium]
MSILVSIALFPPIDYMALLLFHPEVRIEAHENYGKQSFRNRYQIIGPNGLQALSVPVDKRGQARCPIREAAIVSGHWPMVHLRSLDAAYNSSPWYLYFRPEMEGFLLNRSGMLWDFNLQSIALCAVMLGEEKWQPRLSASWEKSATGMTDYREAFHPKRVHPSLTDAALPEQYRQVFGHKWGFIPGMSVLDLIFNEGPAARGYLAKRYGQLLPNLEQNASPAF